MTHYTVAAAIVLVQTDDGRTRQVRTKKALSLLPSLLPLSCAQLHDYLDDYHLAVRVCVRPLSFRRGEERNTHASTFMTWLKFVPASYLTITLRATLKLDRFTFFTRDGGTISESISGVRFKKIERIENPKAPGLNQQKKEGAMGLVQLARYGSSMWRREGAL